MLNTISINLKTDIKTDRPTTLPITLMSQDKNNNQFILRFTNGGESVTLDDTYTVEVLTKFTKSGTSRLTTAKVRQDYATWEFDTAYITQDETVYNYVYVRKSGNLVVSADANCFVFSVDLSEIDKGAGKVAEVYDENYEKVLADYSGALDERTTERLDEAVADFNHRGNAEIADWRTSADSELADKVHNFKIKNEVLNGDFSLGLVNWSNTYANAAIVDGIAEVTATANTGQIRQNFSNQVIGEKFYVCAKIKADSPLVGVTLSGLKNNSNAFHTGDDSFRLVSFTGEITVTAIVLRIYDTRTSGFTKFYVDNILGINLTQTFGAGTEPSKAEMDELIKITGYFDEITLTQKQLLNWQLKLMRQNRNALIALGGTII